MVRKEIAKGKSSEERKLGAAQAKADVGEAKIQGNLRAPERRMAFKLTREFASTIAAGAYCGTMIKKGFNVQTTANKKTGATKVVTTFKR